MTDLQVGEIGVVSADQLRAIRIWSEVLYTDGWEVHSTEVKPSQEKGKVVATIKFAYNPTTPPERWATLNLTVGPRGGVKPVFEWPKWKEVSK